MTSGADTKPLLARNLKVTEHQLLSNSPTFSSYQVDLDRNISVILLKYAHLDRKKVSDLLEELDNNRELALKILEEEDARCNSIIEERRDIRRLPPLSQEEENRILKQSYLNIYRKLIAKTAELEEITKKYQAQCAENQRLKQLNHLLLNEKYTASLTYDSTPIF